MSPKSKAGNPKHIIVDARIRRASTGKPVERLLEHLQNIDNENRYTVLLEPSDPWKPSSRKFKTVACKYRQFSLNPLQQIAFAWYLYRLKPDLVHFTMTGQQPLFYFGRQITFTHDLTMFKYARAGRLPKWLHWLRMKGYRLLVWQAHRKAVKILVPTEYVRNAVAKFHLFTGRKLVITPEASEPPISAESQKPKVETKTGEQADLEPFIMYVGSAFPHKNLYRLVEALNLLKEKIPELKLIFVGKQEYHSKQLQRRVNKLPLADDVIFTGFVPAGGLKWLYEHAAAYAFPSLSEGFGLPPLEAMAHGCPVVASNATCIPEVCGDAAIYFDPEATNDMASKILDVLSNKSLREKLITRGYQQVKKYSWKHMTEQTLSVYVDVFRD